MAESDPTKSQKSEHDSAMEDSATESECQSEEHVMTNEPADTKQNPAADPKENEITIILKTSSQEEIIQPEDTSEPNVSGDPKSTCDQSPVERTSEDKSPSESSWKAKGVGALVEKFRSLKSPKRKDATGGSFEFMVDSGVSVSPSQEEKLQSPKKLEHSPGAGTSADDVSPIPVTDDVPLIPINVDAERMGELSPPNLRESGSPRKTSPLRNIIDKCINMMDTAKKVGQTIKPPFSAKTEKEKSFDSQCSECTRIRNTPHENLSFDSECDECQRIRGMPNKNFIQTMFDKTKGYILDRMGQSEAESSTDSSSQDIMRQLSLDTPSSGVLGDVSGNAETASSTSTSPDIFMAIDQKSRPTLARHDTVIEVKPQPLKPVSPLVKRVKDEETVKPSDVNLDITPQRRTPPLKRQQKIREKDSDSGEIQPIPTSAGNETILEEENKFKEVLPEEKLPQNPSNVAESAPEASIKDETGKRSAEFDSKNCDSPLKKPKPKE